MEVLPQSLKYKEAKDKVIH